jgi:hypothetical protein
MYFVQKIVENVEIFVENNNFPSLMLAIFALTLVACVV